MSRSIARLAILNSLGPRVMVSQVVHLASPWIQANMERLLESKLCTVKPVLSSNSKRRPKNVFQKRILLNAGQKYCRMLQGEHSAIFSTFIKLPFAIKTFQALFCLLLSGRLRQVSIFSVHSFTNFAREHSGSVV